MKYSSILIIAAFLSFFTSCGIGNDETIDFSGEYEGKLDCHGELKESTGESIKILIAKTGVENSYTIDLGDEVIFHGYQIKDVLIIEAQILNEGQEFDVISFEGEIRQSDSKIIFDFTHQVDDEGESTCFFPMLKL